MIARAAALAAIAIPALAAAAEAPLWEAGFGAAAVELPDYRGSDQSRGYGFPLPFFVYRGDFLKADRQGIRGVLLRDENVTFNLSAGASLPVRSSENRAREGMPDLRPSVEIGPSAELTLWREAGGGAKLDLRSPVRAAVTVSRDPRYIGVQWFPHLNLDIRNPGGLGGWNLGLVAGPVLTDARYNRYFYSVAPQFATASRPAYEAKGGYGGTQFVAALSRRFPRFWVGAFARYDTLRGAAFESSPLVTSKRYVAAGVGLTWVFAESSRHVTVDPVEENR